MFTKYLCRQAPQEHACSCHLVYDGLLEGKPWSGLLDALRRQFEANYASLTIRMPTVEDRGLVVFAGAARPHIHAIYSSSLYAVDPFVNLPRDTVVVIEELIQLLLCSVVALD